MAKLVATELAQQTADACLQCFGGYGTMEEYPVARFFRDARFGTIVAGTSEIMREIISRITFEGETPRPVAERAAAPAQVAAVPPAGVTSPAQAEPALVPATVPDLIRSLPQRMRAGKSEGWQTTFHFKLSHCEHPEWTVRIEGDSCAVNEGLSGTPDCVVEMSGETYIGIETGTVNPQVAFMMHKVKVSDVGQMMRFVKVFRPAAR
jgi:putative sterol carrier protein